MKHGYVARYGHVRIRPLEETDLELLRKWRNDQAETRFLRSIPHITSEMQRNWFESTKSDPSELVFAVDEVDELNRLVGSLSLYDLEPKRAQIGKIRIGEKDAHGKGIGRIALVLGMKVGFELLGLDTIWATVHQENGPAHHNDMKIGFQIVGQVPSEVGGIEDVIEIDEAGACKANPWYEDAIVGTNKQDA